MEIPNRRLASVFLSVGCHSLPGIRRPITPPDVIFCPLASSLMPANISFRLWLITMFTLYHCPFLLILYNLTLCTLSSSCTVYCVSFLSAHDFLWRAILATDFFSPQYGQIPLGAPEQNLWWLLSDAFPTIAVLHHSHFVCCSLFFLWTFS